MATTPKKEGTAVAADPWVHRASGMRCSSCMWFVQKVNQKNEMSNLGRCRRHSPTMNGYPAVFVHDWCGDHKMDENRL